MDESPSPLTVSELITKLERFNPDVLIRVDTCIQGRGCWSTDVIDIEERRPPAPPGSPLILIGVTVDQWKSRLEEVKQKLESMKTETQE